MSYCDVSQKWSDSVKWQKCDVWGFKSPSRTFVDLYFCIFLPAVKQQKTVCVSKFTTNLNVFVPKPHSSFSPAVSQQPHLWAPGADGRSEDLLGSTWPWSDVTARPCLASAASERHFSPGSPEETPLHNMLFLPAAALCCLCSGECFQPIRSQQSPPGTNTVTLTFIYLSVSLQRWLPWHNSWFRSSYHWPGESLKVSPSAVHKLMAALYTGTRRKTQKHSKGFCILIQELIKLIKVTIILRKMISQLWTHRTAVSCRSRTLHSIIQPPTTAPVGREIPTVRNDACSLNKNLQMNRSQTELLTGREQ